MNSSPILAVWDCAVTLLNCEYHNWEHCFCYLTFAKVAIVKYIHLNIAKVAIVKYIHFNIANFLILWLWHKFYVICHVLGHMSWCVWHLSPPIYNLGHTFMSYVMSCVICHDLCDILHNLFTTYDTHFMSYVMFCVICHVLCHFSWSVWHNILLHFKLF